jgi:hypothetical protein
MRVSTALVPTAVMAISALLACDTPDPLSPVGELSAWAAARSAPTTFEAPFQFDIDCGGYTVRNSGIATGHLSLLPAGGTPTRSVIHFSLRGSLTNTTTGRSVPQDADFTTTEDIATGEVTIAGAVLHVVSVGTGIVILDVGIVRFDAAGQPTFEPGRHDLQTGDADALSCELLA